MTCQRSLGVFLCLPFPEVEDDERLPYIGIFVHFRLGQGENTFIFNFSYRLVFNSLGFFGL